MQIIFGTAHKVHQNLPYRGLNSLDAFKTS